MKPIASIFCICVLIQAASLTWAQERITERIPTEIIEDGKPISLEIVIHKPSGEGPFPALVFNHGSIGSLDQAKYTIANLAIAKFFNERGWLVAYPQRRGRGKSDGRYAGGSDGLQHSCNPEVSLPELERSLVDIAASMTYVSNRPDVVRNRLAIGGHSRGGILSIVYAGEHPDTVTGVVNFSGGWMSDRCPRIEEINTASFIRGARFPNPTLWIYAEQDHFYLSEHSRKNFDAFTRAGGKGKFLMYVPKPGRDGHNILGDPEQYGYELDLYIKQMNGR